MHLSVVLLAGVCSREITAKGINDAPIPGFLAIDNKVAHCHCNLSNNLWAMNLLRPWLLFSIPGFLREPEYPPPHPQRALSLLSF